MPTDDHGRFECAGIIEGIPEWVPGYVEVGEPVLQADGPPGAVRSIGKINANAERLTAPGVEDDMSMVERKLEAWTPNDELGEAVRQAAKKIASRQAGAVDDAIAALVTAGVPLRDIEVRIHMISGLMEVGVRR